MAILKQNEEDFSFIEENKYYYVLDASAVIKYPDLKKYGELFKKIKLPAVFVMIPAFLNEVDSKKHQDNNGGIQFTLKLCEFAEKKKLSKGVEIAPNTEVLFYNKKIENKENYYSYLNEGYVDKELIIFAKKIRKKTSKVAIISRDGLLKVLCREEQPEIIYIFAPNEIPSITSRGKQDSSGTSAPVNNDKITTGSEKEENLQYKKGVLKKS